MKGVQSITFEGGHITELEFVCGCIVIRSDMGVQLQQVCLKHGRHIIHRIDVPEEESR